MAKVPFTKLGLVKNTEVKNININGQDIEVKQYLPLEEKLNLISDVINNIQDDNNFLNSAKLEVFFNLSIIFKYTNINFTEKQKEDVYKLYDLLVSNNIIEKIREAIPSNEYHVITDWVCDIAHNVYEYRNSAYGIVEAISQDKDKLNFDATEIQEKLANGDNLELLKNILEKMG